MHLIEGMTDEIGNYLLGMSGRVFKLDNFANSDTCCQIVKKYNKFGVHVGPFKIGVMGGPPESFESVSYVAKKGLAGNSCNFMSVDCKI